MNFPVCWVRPLSPVIVPSGENCNFSFLFFCCCLDSFVPIYMASCILAFCIVPVNLGKALCLFATSLLRFWWAKKKKFLLCESVHWLLWPTLHTGPCPLSRFSWYFFIDPGGGGSWQRSRWYEIFFTQVARRWEHTFLFVSTYLIWPFVLVHVSCGFALRA